MEIEGPHEHNHRPHSTGFAGSTSASRCRLSDQFHFLTVAIKHGRTMDKLVASNSFPNIDVEHGNKEDLKDGLGQRPVLYMAS